MRTVITLFLCLMANITLASTKLFTISVRDANMGDFASYELRDEESFQKSRLYRTNRTDSWIEVEGKDLKVLRQLEFQGELKGKIYLLQEDGFGDMRPKSLLYKNENDSLHLKTRGSSSREFVLTGTLKSKDIRVTFEKFAGRSSRFDDSQYNAFGDDTFLRSYASGSDWSYRVKIWGTTTEDEAKKNDQMASALGGLMLHIQNPTAE